MFFTAIDGGWTEFSDWTSCSQTCGGGVQERRRTCSSPSPKNGGKDCQGTHTEIQDCVERENCGEFLHRSTVIDQEYRPTVIDQVRFLSHVK